MKKTGKKLDQPATATSLREAIHMARVQEAEELDSSVDRRSTEMARLEVLFVAVEHVFDDIPFEDDRFNLALVPSKPARLWIDIMTYVAMDNSGEIYRMIRNEGTGRKVMVETEDVGVMAGRITEFVARYSSMTSSAQHPRCQEAEHCDPPNLMTLSAYRINHHPY